MNVFQKFCAGLSKMLESGWKATKFAGRKHRLIPPGRKGTLYDPVEALAKSRGCKEGQNPVSFLRRRGFKRLPFELVYAASDWPHGFKMSDEKMSARREIAKAIRLRGI